MQVQNLFSTSEDAMKRTTGRLKCEVSHVRTGRANRAMVEGIKIKNYDYVVSISQIAAINVLDAKTIEIKPWDTSQLNAIEKAILKADIGISPIIDGELVRLSIPSLTEDRRKEIAKAMNKMAEKFKIDIRNERRILIENIKKLEKNKIITEDDKKKFEIKAQKITDVYIKKIDEIIEIKEKEIMQIL
ncbi:MAG: ribosome recycling factor [Endomicrobium sp.]|jgi:ribosome recycling factor|nr:ribosome recycling factor [Endomicrobium sp.]